ncbi:hypothetical protein D9M68_551210 [compost metagenome]
MLVVEAIHQQLLPFDEVAFLDGVQGVHLVDQRAAGNAQGQWLGALEVDIEVAVEQAAAQLQAHEGADVGLGYAQVDVAGLHLQLRRDGLELDLADRLHLALLAEAAIDAEVEGRFAPAVEVLEVQVQRAQFQLHWFLGHPVGQVDLVAAQLGIAQQHHPWLAGLGLGIGRLGGGFLRGLGGRFGLAGEELLPVQLAIGFAGGPGFQVLAVDLADHHLLLHQVQGAVADFQQLEIDQGTLVRRLDGEGRDLDPDLVQVELGALGQAQLVVGGEADHTLLQHQGHGIPDVGPDALQLAVGELQLAAGTERHQGDLALPVDPSAVGAGGHQRHFGAVVGQGTEIAQFQIEGVVDELDGFAGAQVLEVQAALAQLDAIDTQGKGLAGRLFRLGLAGRELEQLGQVERAVLGEQHLGGRLVQLDVRQVQGAGPEAVQLQVGVEPLEAGLLGLVVADVQSPEAQLQAEGVELDTLQVRGHRGVLGQLLVGHPQGDPRDDQKAKQAVEREDDQQGAGGPFQSFVHEASTIPAENPLDYGTASGFRQMAGSRCCATFRAAGPGS